MRVSDREVNNIQELEIELACKDKIPEKYAVAVEALVFDKNGKWILMERGLGCRDEVGKLEGIGGKFEEDDDKNFISALKREIVEEVGSEAQIDILKFFEVRKDTVGEKNWIIISYICIHRFGELRICEPTKNNGFIHLEIDEIDPIRLSSSAASALRSLKTEWSDVKELLNKG